MAPQVELSRVPKIDELVEPQEVQYVVGAHDQRENCTIDQVVVRVAHEQKRRDERDELAGHAALGDVGVLLDALVKPLHTVGEQQRAEQEHPHERRESPELRHEQDGDCKQPEHDGGGDGDDGKQLANDPRQLPWVIAGIRALAHAVHVDTDEAQGRQP